MQQSSLNQDATHDSPSSQWDSTEHFLGRHIGPSLQDQQKMLTTLGVSNIESLMAQTIPENILLNRPLRLPKPLSEAQALKELETRANQNSQWHTHIGMGYYGTVTPAVIQRNLLENPGWYTAYTPYQAEISQGRLEALLNYQQLVMDLTGMEIANASMLDEATAAAEAMTMAYRLKRPENAIFFVDNNTHPQTLAVIKTRAEALGIGVEVDDIEQLDHHDYYAALISYPGSNGQIPPLELILQKIKKRDALACVVADPLALTLLASPGSFGADVVVGSMQRYGVPMAYGGPHAAFFATKEAYKRSLPGRLIGVSRDSRGNPALRMALQTREQHIRREKANSNICTAQVLLANMAGFYAVYHGPYGLKNIALRVHQLTASLAKTLANSGVQVLTDFFFDTITCRLPELSMALVKKRAQVEKVNLRWYADGRVGISLDETSQKSSIERLVAVFLGEKPNIDGAVLKHDKPHWPSNMHREGAWLSHSVFHQHHSETELLRYLKRLENKDLSLTQSMIPLGSCTMKLNASAEMMPISWPLFANLHPFVPLDQAKGYSIMIEELSQWLAEITGYDAISLQPNSGAQGEYAGLLAIRDYHRSRGDHHRTQCLIPASAHGTNPASAQLAGMDVVVVSCDDHGNIDTKDLSIKLNAAGERLSCLMVTYPSTHGVFETSIRSICDQVHQLGGQVYMDGANLNAQVGLTRPGDMGADVSHLNLHKTFCIPHGGGGPGMGPIGVKAHLVAFLPKHPVIDIDYQANNSITVNAAPWGSAGILPISWMYIAMMGPSLKQATQVAILNANYVAERLQDTYPVLYRGEHGRVAHECILDLRPIKAATGVSEEDIAKRLMDYGFHAPTMSFPVPGTLMIEPTESESLSELDRFVEAMLLIGAEIKQVEQGLWTREDNPLVNAPHTLEDVIHAWERPYSLAQAITPTPHTRAYKYWPTVNRIDQVHGDRHLICGCPPISAYRSHHLS